MLCDCFSGRDRSNNISHWTMVAERAGTIISIGRAVRMFSIGRAGMKFSVGHLWSTVVRR